MANKTCNGCHIDEVSAYEVGLAFAERTAKRQWIVIILLVCLLVLTNLGWLWYESRFETVDESYEVKQEAESGDNYSVIGDGYINGDTDD